MTWLTSSCPPTLFLFRLCFADLVHESGVCRQFVCPPSSYTTPEKAVTCTLLLPILSAPLFSFTQMTAAIPSMVGPACGMRKDPEGLGATGPPEVDTEDGFLKGRWDLICSSCCHHSSLPERLDLLRGSECSQLRLWNLML